MRRRSRERAGAIDGPLGTRAEFAVPRDVPIDDLLERISALPRIGAERPRQRTRRYYDTFDGRLFAAGDVLEAEPGNGGLRVTLRRLGGGVRAREVVEQVPRFAESLPAGAMRERVARVAKIRALQPLVSVDSVVHRFRLLGSEGKTVARIELAVTDDARAVASAIPVKGYDKQAKRAVKLLERELELERIDVDPLLHALAAEGRAPEGYSSALDVVLTPGMSAGAALEALLNRLLEILTVNEPGVRADIDSEFLHDYRVSVRRTRSLLGRVRGVLSSEQLATLEPELAWLGALTSPPRDMDVYLLRFPEYRETIPRSMRTDLDPLRRFLEEHKRASLRAMVEGLDSARYEHLIAQWRDFAEHRGGFHAKGELARRPIVEVAGAEIQRMYKRLVKRTRQLGDRPPASALHQLRKDCKKLRYLIEAFRSLYAPAGVRHLLSALKPMQNKLGDIQDIDVQIEALRTFGAQMIEEDPTIGPATVMAMGVLVERLEKRQHEVRRGLRAPLEHMTSLETRKLVRKLLQTPQSKAHAL